MFRSLRFVVLACAFVFAIAACENGAAVGTPCAHASECARGLVCHFGRCRAECAENRDCPLGASCYPLPDGLGACGVDTDLGCESGVGRACSPGLVCAADRCESVCTVDADCPSDGRCLSLASGTRFCFAVRDGDAGLPDGGDDAGIDAPQPFDAGTDAGPIDGGVSTVGIADVCIGSESACALGNDGHVYCWGHAVDGQLGRGGDCTTLSALDLVPAPVVVGGAPIVADAITCGDGFACASGGGQLLCWGRNDLGQLGDGTTTACNAVPQVVRSATGPLSFSLVPSISAAAAHACVVDREAGTLFCWGRDDGAFGAAGGTDIRAVTRVAFDVGGPVSIEPMLGVDEVRVAPDVTCVHATGLGGVTCWGDTSFGQLGYVSATPAGIRTTLSTSASQVAVGRHHHCLLTSFGTVSCAGDDSLLQLGHSLADLFVTSDCGASVECSATERAIGPGYLVTQIASHGDGDTTCALGGVGPYAAQVFCWGADDKGQAGYSVRTSVAVTDASMSSPVAVTDTSGATLHGVRRIAVGPTMACAVDSRGVLSCWGDLGLGTGTATERATVIDVRAPSGP